MVLLLAWFGRHTGKDATGTRLRATHITVDWGATTDLNARVYALFDLTPAEIQLVEESTKYRYGEV
jgi:hypothetical protein